MAKSPSAFLSAPASATAEGEGGDLLNRARELEAEQAALVETASVESRYAAALAVQVEAKREQVERIEDRLEDLIGREEARLQQTQAQRPGLLALPGRLDSVREIKEGMGRHGPRLEDLARRKLRAEDPALAAEWREFQEAQRRHQALLRKRRQEEGEKQRRGGLDPAPRLALRLER